MDGLNGVIFVESAALLPVHPAEPRRRAAQHRRRDGGGGAEPRRARLAAVPPHRVPARAARLRRRRLARVRQGVRRPRHAAGAERHQHARAAGLPAHHLGRARGSDRLRDQRAHDRVLDRSRCGPSARIAEAAATTRRCSAAARRCRGALTPWQASLAYGWIALVLLLVLSPHLGILLLSLAKVWSFSVLPERLHAARTTRPCSRDSPRMIGNTLLYCGAGGADRRGARHRDRLPHPAHAPARAPAARLDRRAPRSRFPASCSAIGYLRAFRGVELPFGTSALTASWLRHRDRLRGAPPALRAALVHGGAAAAARLARGSGGEPRRRARRARSGAIVVPLMAGGILAGFVTSFITAAVELSATILLTSRAEPGADVVRHLPLHAVGIAGRGPGAALGVHRGRDRRARHLRLAPLLDRSTAATCDRQL